MGFLSSSLKEASINVGHGGRSAHTHTVRKWRESIHTSAKTMWLVLLTYQLASFLLLRAEYSCFTHDTFRSPVNSDIKVFCGSEILDLHILLCPIYFRRYNESLMALNSEHSKPECKGTADWTVDPPILKFNFSITEEGIASCSSNLTVIQQVGTGIFSDFSTIEYVNISGKVCSEDLLITPVVYLEEVIYKFSCLYPLQYLVNNTQMSVSGANLVIQDNNGSFISTLRMGLYSDNSFSSSLLIPQEGLELKTRIFVKVMASNLSDRFNVLLDRCYVTRSPLVIDTSSHDLFVGCDQDSQTIIDTNGQEQEASFSFEAFRFIENRNDLISTYYVHCVTRLCLKSICQTVIQNCTSSRRRRSTSDQQDTTVSDSATISSGPIRISSGQGYMHGSKDSQHQTVVVVSVIAGIIGLICLTLAAFIIYRIYIAKNISGKTILYPPE